MCTWNFSFSANKHRHNNNRPFGDRAPTSYKYGNTQCQLYLQLVLPRPFSTFVLFLIVFLVETPIRKQDLMSPLDLYLVLETLWGIHRIQLCAPPYMTISISI